MEDIVAAAIQRLARLIRKVDRIDRVLRQVRAETQLCFIFCAPDDRYMTVAITNDLALVGMVPHTVVRRILMRVDLHPSLGVRAHTKIEVRSFAHWIGAAHCLDSLSIRHNILLLRVLIIPLFVRSFQSRAKWATAVLVLPLIKMLYFDFILVAFIVQQTCMIANRVRLTERSIALAISVIE
jgi:hypothetical protein